MENIFIIIAIFLVILLLIFAFYRSIVKKNVKDVKNVVNKKDIAN